MLKRLFLQKDDDQPAGNPVIAYQGSGYGNLHTAELDEGYDGWTSNVDEIYGALDLDGENSVYRVQELVASLPKELPKEDIKKSLVGICAVARINMSALADDGHNRKAALCSYNQQFVDHATAEIEKHEEAIAEAEATIEASKKRILGLKTLSSELVKNINAEETRIDDLITYLS